MANLYLYLDMRTPHANGAGSLKLAISHKRKVAYEPLGIYIRPDEWNAERQQVVSRADKKFQNIIIKKRMAECTLALQRLMLRDDMDSFSAKDILQILVRGSDMPDTAADADYLLPVYNEYIGLAKKASTAAVYRSSLNNLKEYAQDIDTLRFKDIDVAWLRRYSAWLTDEKNMETNGANVYLRNLRTVFNYAIMQEYTKARYPFRDIDMSTTEPDKREIPYKKFLEWVSRPMADFRDFYRDLFMLSFYLCGIRPVDLLNAKKSQVVDGRLVYWPEKLNGRTKLSIKIEPEAWEIIHKYEGEEHLINIMDTRTDYRAFCAHWNKALKAIGEDLPSLKKGRGGKIYTVIKHSGIVPYISAYYARSCWGTYAYNILELPMDIISQALGHKSGLRVTNFYVKREEAKVDKANRALIDRINKDVDEYKRENNIT